MKRISIRLTIILITFFVGVTAATIWLFNLNNSSIEITETGIDCNFPDFENSAISVKENKEANITILERFQEIPLENLPDCIDESYRLVWIPTFHSSVVVRVWRSADKHFLVVKQLDGKGGYGMGNLALNETRPLTENEWFNLVSLIERSSFWNMPTINKNEGEPNDGALWIVEGINGKKYHDVTRLTPNDEYRELAGYLIQLSGLKTEYQMY